MGQIPLPSVFNLSFRRAIIFWLACTAIFLPLSVHFGPLWFFDQDGIFRISDFGYYLTLTRAVWTGENIRIYDVATHLPVLSKLAGAPVSGALPLAVLPTALILWLPFAIIPPALFYFSSAAWVSLGLTTLAGPFLGLVSLFPRGSRPRLGMILIILITVTSSTFISAIILGQTSLIALGCMCFLLRRTATVSGKSARVLEAAALYILSIKIHYLLAVFVLVLGVRRRELLQHGTVLIFAALAGMTAILGPVWISDYKESLGLFFSEAKPPWLAPGFVAENMIIFSGAFAPILGPGPAAKISKLVLVASTAAASLLAISIFISKKHPQGSLLPFFLLISGYLLFTPYMGHYEDLLLLAPFAAAATRWPRKMARPAGLIFVAAALFIVLNRGLFRPNFPIWPFWLLKAALLGMLAKIQFSSRAAG